MRCICLRGMALLTAAFLMLAAGIAAAQQSGQVAASSPDEIRMIGSGGAQAVPQAVGENPASAVLEEPRSGVPTRAKHRPASNAKAAIAAAKAKPDDDRAKSKSDDASLSPIPDAQEGPPVPVVAASFKGIVPGTSSKTDVEAAWGAPKRATSVHGGLVELYSVQPFKRVEVHYAGGSVSSIVIRLDRWFPVNAVAKQLDLTAIRPVLVVNELGEVLGRAYPERGVLLAFVPGKKPGEASMKVSQIILEPISAESFVLRAETMMESRYDLSRRDLEQALSLQPGNARAHWLYSRVLAATEQYQKAVKAAGEAVRLDPHDAQYRVTYAQNFAQAGQLSEALAQARKAVALSADRPHVKARATCMVADLLASGPNPDFKKALTVHTEALKLADSLSADPHPAIRLAAKEVQIDAYLGAAHDIAWGEWKDKPRAVKRWLARAKAVADDLVLNEGGSEEQLFRVYARALAACVGLRDAIDPAADATGLMETGEKLVAAARDPGRKARLQWELGMALYDAVQICQMRSEGDKALKYGEAAAGYLAHAIKARPSSTSTFLLGRLYFRLGAIYAMNKHDHQAAVGWFDKALPLLEQATPEDLADGVGRQGQAFVGMGVSYWETGQHDKAVALTSKGVVWMEQAVKQGALERSALVVPYGNLASMQRKLGDKTQAKHFQEMADRLKSDQLK
jgi:tetratricopeptide (TPR) repeat protein